MNWLLTGEGEMLQADHARCPGGAAEPAQTLGSRATDPDLMGRIIDTIRAVYRAQGQAIPDRTLGELAARWYDEIDTASDDAGDRLRLLAEHQIALGEELRRAACDPTSGKRQA